MKPTTPRRYRLRVRASGTTFIVHPSGYWIGPGTGTFPTPAAAMDWLARELRTF